MADPRIEAAELSAFEPLDEVLANLLAVALDKRRHLPMHVRLPAAMRDVRHAFATETEHAAVKAAIWKPKRPTRAPAMRSLERLRESLKVRPLIAAVAAARGMEERHLVGASRVAAVVRARDEASWVIRDMVRIDGEPISYPMIGLALGGRDHSTVIAACRRVEARIARDPDLRLRLRLLAIGGAPAQAARAA